MRLCALAIAVLTLAPFNASAQTNAAHTSKVGTWKVDIAKSNFGSEAAPKEITLTLLKDTPALTSWRFEVVEATGESSTMSWSGPLDGTPQPVKDPKGQVLMTESMSLEKDGVLIRKGVDPSGMSFAGRATLSADGNTITDVITLKTKDGKTSQMTVVFQRAKTGK